MKNLVKFLFLLLPLLAGCQKESEPGPDVPVQTTLSVRLSVSAAYYRWNSGDAVHWVDRKNREITVVLDSADIVSDSVAVADFTFTHDRNENSTEGYFYLNSKADGTCPFTLGRAADSTFTVSQKAAGENIRELSFLVSSFTTQSVDLLKTDAEAVFKPQGMVLNVRPYTLKHNDEKVKSVTIRSDYRISGNVTYDHSFGVSGPISDYAAKNCVTQLSEHMSLGQAVSAEKSADLKFVLPPTGIILKQVMVETDSAKYTSNIKLSYVGKDGRSESIPVFLDECIRTHGKDIDVPVPADGVSLDWSYMTLYKNSSRTLTATVSPEKASCKDVTWRVTNRDVLSVDNGIVKAMSEGTSKVIVSTMNGACSDTCTVRVISNDFRDLNRHYDVSVSTDGRNWKSVQVYDALCSNDIYHQQIWNDWNNSKKLRDTMAIALFEDEFSGPLKVRVKKKDGSFGSAAVRPTKYGLTAANIGSNSIEFTIPSYEFRKLSIEFDGDRQHNLFLVGMRPDTGRPSQYTPKVHYYGPGEHQIGKLTLREGETLYADFGAVVYGTIEVTGNNTTIAGHGIISGARERHTGNVYSTGSMLIQVNPFHPANTLSNFTIRDVTLLDSPSWTLCLYKTRGFTIDGVNEICWILNGDGIDIVSCAEGSIQNCLLRNYDDCITLKENGNYYPVHDLEDVEISNNILYNDLARGIAIGPECGSLYYGTGWIHDIDIHDCCFLHDAGSTSTSSDVLGCFVIYQRFGPDWDPSVKTVARNVYDITARRLYFDNVEKTGRNVCIYQDKNMSDTCSIYNVLLEDFTIEDNLGCENPACYINTNQHSIRNLTVRNFIYNGRKITEADNRTFVVKGKADIKFE